MSGSASSPANRAARPPALKSASTPLRLRLSILALLLVLIAALAAPLLAPYEPYEQNLDRRFSPPLSQGHILGTDSLGRDILSRLIFSARSALVVGLLSTAVALLIAFPIALLASYSSVDSALLLLMDGLLALPAILLALAFVSVFGYGLVQVMLALGVVFAPLLVRLLRAEINKARSQDFVRIEALYNRPQYEIFRIAVLPQILPPLLVQLTNLFAISVSIEAGLSFLGIGVQPPQSSWGIMLNDARNYLLSNAWLAIAPGIALVALVYSINTISDYISEKLL